MSKTKRDALNIVFAAAKEYQNNLVNYSLLFLCMDKHKNTYCMEVFFPASRFQHLTGLITDQSSIVPLHFFQLCLNQRLNESDFEFAENGMADWKLDVITRIVKKDISANMIGTYNNIQPLLSTEKMAGNVSACIGFVKNDGIGGYVPNTLLKGDIRNLVYVPDRIIVTYRKKFSDNHYSEIVHVARKIDWSKIKLPEEYLYLPLPNKEH